ncbi:aminotransferase class I/II-fold pyridoxal phosphate-dependent enzyme [Embleya sp. NPDC050493]|uniref:aminotransferase class I/II-fold pyridoxal phosphate-dependent enzyme n=1 Tax=Embleya sp. NPDC050493 TaxID=3363989 RepID=UPI0037A545C0
MTHIDGESTPDGPKSAPADPILRSAALLEAVACRHPKAISFAGRRPYGDTATGPPTTGERDALLRVLRVLRGSDRDVVLAVAPAYLGLIGAARRADMPVLPVADGPRGVDLDDLAAQVYGARAAGLRPRALYVVPDFANPSGIGLDRLARCELLATAAELDLLLLEDDPYGLIHVAGDRRPPTLAALDTRQRVVHVGSFAETGRPGRLGRIGNPAHLLNGLAARFGRGPAADRVHWSSPDGGFLVVLTVPFVADDELVELSAREYGVMWTPMAHFYHPGIGPAHRLRLSCGTLDPATIDHGLNRLATLIGDRTGPFTTVDRPTVHRGPAPGRRHSRAGTG